MSAWIFLNYRRDDAAAETHNISEALRREVGDESVFMDISSNKAGDVWPQRIRDAIEGAEVVIAVIGPNWLRAGTNEWGQRRIDDEQDWVRQELTLAFEQKKRVIPVLVSGAKMPPAQALPGPIRALPERQALEIRRDYTAHDTKLLLVQLGMQPASPNKPLTSEAPPSPAPPFISFHDHCLVDKDSVRAVLESATNEVSIHYHQKVKNALGIVKERFENFDTFVQECSWYKTLNRTARVNRIIELRSGIVSQYEVISWVLKRNTSRIPILLEAVSDAKENFRFSALHTYTSLAAIELIMRLQGFQSGTQEAGCPWETDLFPDLPDIPVRLFELVPNESPLGQMVFGVSVFAHCQVGTRTMPSGYVLMPVYDAETILERSADQEFHDYIYYLWVVPQLVLQGVPVVGSYEWTILKMRDANNREKRFAHDEWKGFFDA